MTLIYFSFSAYKLNLRIMTSELLSEKYLAQPHFRLIFGISILNKSYNWLKYVFLNKFFHSSERKYIFYNKNK